MTAASLRRAQGHPGSIHHAGDGCGFIPFFLHPGFCSVSHVFINSELKTGSWGILNQRKVTQSASVGLQTPAGVSLNCVFFFFFFPPMRT